MSLISRSNELRKLIVHTAKANNIPLTQLTSWLGIDTGRFISLYINRNDLNSKAPMGVKESDIIEVAKALGVDVRITIIKRSLQFDELRTTIANAYKEKRIAAESKKSNIRGDKAIGGSGDIGDD